MLRINEYAAQKIICAYNTMNDKEKFNRGSQSQSILEVLYQASTVCDNAIELASALGCEPDIILSDNIVKELTCIAQMGKL
ncbi:hypothetical protein PP422_gp016 [Enterobacter phage vB_EhoM-IME523]|jgi:hypothetical protein|uniref:Uncharacterized protein n=2 Tax=Kanagawavirus TaxID=2843399 RepID=A0A6B9XZD5_9CAUD|nr:hypothetical protein HWD05_gp119 [Enterobacter phage vB_EclM_CIP9]YP_010650267.1 hypothetical protein PP422_gp016 [Enterobacter phage vB_EhoM-IME523]QEA10495.1 hypothetical protein [Enterobacter phage vB_EhoM-IME523]QHS01655.1 hypothetical protein CPT_CIP9_119 [Enterobacter phage vB_EclM_CIP9]UTY64255.1 hypothetical protein ENTB45_078 [Enterobacter phage Entb_45]